MKSIREFCKEFGYDVQMVNNKFINSGVNVVEDFKNNDGFFPIDIYERFLSTLNNYTDIVNSYNIEKLADYSIPLHAKDRPVVYILFDNDEIVYIGQSCGLFYRINEHIRNKKFTKIAILFTEKEHLDIIEMMLILKHKPKYNLHGTDWSLFCMLIKKSL